MDEERYPEPVCTVEKKCKQKRGNVKDGDRRQVY